MPYQPRIPPRHELIAVRGIRHHVSRWGPFSDDPLVMMHGWADTADTFQFVVDALKGDWPVAAFDWRGFGRTAARTDSYWFPDYFADLDQLLDRLCPKGPARLVGHSMGGNVALMYAGIRPERVRCVVSMEGFGLARTHPEQAPERIRKWLEQLRESPVFGEYGSFDELAQLLLRRNPRLTRDRAEFIARSWAATTPEGKVRVLADPGHKLVNPYLYRRDEAEACWRQITAPAMLVLAEQSEFLPKLGTDGMAASLRENMPAVRVEVLPGAGHMLHHEQPEAVAHLLEAFLSSADRTDT